MGGWKKWREETGEEEVEGVSRGAPGVAKKEQGKEEEKDCAKEGKNG